VCIKCHTYDKAVSANARLCAFLRLLYPIVLLNCKTRGLTFYFTTKKRKKFDIILRRCRSRFQINVYWSRHVPNINAFLPTEANTATVLPAERGKKWKWEGVNPLALCTESYVFWVTSTFLQDSYLCIAVFTI